MKKLVLFIIFLSVSYAVNTYSQPQIVISATGGYNLPLPDLKGNFPDSISGTTADSNTYLIKQGFNFGLTGKYALGKKRNVRVNLGFAYNMFNQSKDYDGGYSLKNKMNIINIAAGVEYAFQPRQKVNPYVGLDLGAYLYSGDIELTGPISSKGTLKSATRFGGAIGGGIEFMFSKQIGANIGVKYHMANLIGKAYDTTGLGPNEYPLNDKEHTMGNMTNEFKKYSVSSIVRRSKLSA